MNFRRAVSQPRVTRGRNLKFLAAHQLAVQKNLEFSLVGDEGTPLYRGIFSIFLGLRVDGGSAERRKHNNGQQPRRLRQNAPSIENLEPSCVHGVMIPPEDWAVPMAGSRMPSDKICSTTRDVSPPASTR